MYVYRVGIDERKAGSISGIHYLSTNLRTQCNSTKHSQTSQRNYHLITIKKHDLNFAFFSSYMVSNKGRHT